MDVKKLTDLDANKKREMVDKMTKLERDFPKQLLVYRFGTIEKDTIEPTTEEFALQQLNTLVTNLNYYTHGFETISKLPVVEFETRTKRDEQLREIQNNIVKYTMLVGGFLNYGGEQK